ncbi:MAG: radical SAM protein [Desulfuromonadaceae bacterium]|nr:radical SAM protein [Desulfuromonadaceae bacterium]MDD2855065.1 radical SAM protein [Desulfuromonadaceae bacterium]
MTSSIRGKNRILLNAEISLNKFSSVGRLSICLISPSRYHTGMSSLGFQTVYAQLAGSADILCERAFLPDHDELEEYRRSNTPLLSLESSTPLSDFDVVAFSTSFEPDYLNIPLILNLARIPLYSRSRNNSNPLIIAGGAAFFINPEPVADFIDAICIGEGEEVIPSIIKALLSPVDNGRDGLLRALSRITGLYVPSLYHPRFSENRVTGYDAESGATFPVIRATATLAGHKPAASQILTENTEFGDMFLIEVSRGCPRGCRFCSSGFIYGAFRQQPMDNVINLIERGVEYRNKVGLVGAAVSDYSDIGKLCSYIVAKGAKVSVSSLRVDRIDNKMLDALIASGHKTISLAPEGGSQRLRDLIHKNLTETQILDTCDLLISRDILNLKLYFIIGLPTETEVDLEELIRLVEKIRERVIEMGRANKRLGEISISINPFIPKPFTPFQWCGMEALPSLERKADILEKRLKRLSNVKLKIESLRSSYLQALLSRGDRSLSPMLAEMAAGANLKKAAKICGIDTDSYVLKNYAEDDFLPWSIIATAEKNLLRREYCRALPGEIT